jgi:transcription initiation factor TFIIH subunit 2
MIEDNPVYKWEQSVVATWDAVKEDASGNIIAASSDRERSHHAKQNRITQSIRRGLIRYLVVAIDCSGSSAENDFRPCRLEVCKSNMQNFIAEYYDQNPISQLCLISTKNRMAEKNTELSGNSKIHLEKLKALSYSKTAPSLQNTIELAVSILRHIPSYGHRELLIMFSSLSSCDPGDIFSTLQLAVDNKIRISVVSTGSEMQICRHIAERTNGTCTVAIDALHYSELLLAHTVPPAQLAAATSSDSFTDYIYMGFPKRVFDAVPSLGYDAKRVKFSATAFVCPRCLTRTTDIPSQCSVCTLQLNSSSHIARSYHHLFPVQNFIEFSVRQTISSPKQELVTDIAIRAKLEHYSSDATDMKLARENLGYDDKSLLAPVVPCVADDAYCYGCLTSFSESTDISLRCPQCLRFFCVDCDLFIHDSLHNCPGCCK